MPAFLTDEWFQQADQARAEVGPFDTGTPAKLNLVVTADDGETQAHLDTTEGFAMGPGHLDDADATLTMPADVAQKIFVDGDGSAAMTAFMGGKLKVTGNMGKVMGLQGALAKPEATTLRDKIKAFTD